MGRLSLSARVGGLAAITGRIAGRGQQVGRRMPPTENNPE